MKKVFIFLFCAFWIMAIQAQDENLFNMSEKQTLPYHQIPDYPNTFTPGTVAARVVDGLGYRYYWATEGLTDKDLEYLPGNEGRSAGETLDHLLNLSKMIVNAAQSAPNVRPTPKIELTWEQKREKTLKNFKKASDLFKESENVAEHVIIFQRGEKTSEFPFWNLLNGPIADAIYHVGQIVSYRRSSGNPVNPLMNVFIGKTRE